MKKKNIGSSADRWLREEGIYEDVSLTALKRVLARKVESATKEKPFSKAEMARRKLRSSSPRYDLYPSVNKGCYPSFQVI